MKCPTCSRDLAPAALRKENFWCSVCATEFLPDGGVAPDMAQPLPASVTVPDAPAVKLVDATKEVAASKKGKTFHVVVGDVSFDAQGRVDLTIGTTKVTIT